MTNQKFKILILAAIPHGLRLDAEFRFISECIRGAARRDMFDASIRTAVRPQDIRRAIREEKPHIVHFCGHGKEDGSLVLEDDGGKDKLVSPQGLAALFEQHSDYVKCVVLNACYSVKTADAISEHINYVIGMNQAIGDRAAIVFAQGFYDGLGYEQEDNQDVFQKAFVEGLVAIALEDFSQKSIPVLKKNVSLLNIIEPSNTVIKKLKDIPTNGFEASEVGADYTSLASMLSEQDFKSADKETNRIMLWVARREKEGWLDFEDINKFPCRDLCTIDQLWLASSGGKFGFSVQKQIWIECGGKLGESDFNSNKITWEKFSERLEWKIGDEYVSYDELCWDLRAIDGHLPLASVGSHRLKHSKGSNEDIDDNVLLPLIRDTIVHVDYYVIYPLKKLIGWKNNKRLEQVVTEKEISIFKLNEIERGLLEKPIEVINIKSFHFLVQRFVSCNI